MTSILLDTKAAAATWGVSPKTWRRLATYGHVPPAVNVPGLEKKMWRRSDLERMADSLEPDHSRTKTAKALADEITSHLA